MEIHPYLTVIQGQKEYSARRPSRPPADGGFKVEPSPPDRPAADVIEVVSLENRRAAAQAPPKDLGEAEKVLDRVRRGLDRLTREDLRRVHRLEGLVQVYMT
ncbi:MAG: hypothetical protein AB1896_19915 [Thermodesulfobacteriota bacterium]